MLIRGWALKKYFLEGGRLFEVGRLKSTFWGWALIRGWALKKYFLGAGAYSRLGAYKLFLSSVWALIRGGRLFEKTRPPIQIISSVTRLHFNVNKRLIKSTSCDT